MNSPTVDITIERCDKATVNLSDSSTVLDFTASKSTAEHNTAVMVFRKDGEFGTEPCSPSCDGTVDRCVSAL